MSVFIGLMVSLGGTGIVSQVLGGLVVVYTRAFTAGDYVRIGENEGTVTEIGALTAKVTTVRKEEITIPFSVVVSSATINYSRQAREGGRPSRPTLRSDTTRPGARWKPCCSKQRVGRPLS